MKQYASTWGIAALVCASCGGEPARAPADAAPARAIAVAPPCADPVQVWKDGKPAGEVCPTAAPGLGLTVIDLSDQWTPAALAPEPGAPPLAYRATYLALASERWADAGANADTAKNDRYLELYGVEPTFAVIRARLADEARHACHAAIDPAPLTAMTGTVFEESLDDAHKIVWHVKALRAELDRQRARRRLPDLAALAAVSPAWQATVDELEQGEAKIAATRAAQAHLACDGLMDAHDGDGSYSWVTSAPMEVFQRRAMVLPTGSLDPDTRAALVAGSRELDYRAALRALRERVIAATGLIEDGTAGGGELPVMGRALEPRTTWAAKGYRPAPDAAPDLIDPAADAAARALGWTDAQATLAWLDAHGGKGDAPAPKVAIALPPLPTYHKPQMDLSVVIDRGDVWYDPAPVPHVPAQRPALTLYVKDGARTIALVRWPTTIGGWNDEKDASFEIDKKWKESPPGKRVWHDVWIAPTWMPPDETPDKDLIRVGVDERIRLRKDVLGPGYRSAFGLVAFVHQIPITRHGKVVEYDEEGIRTHGAANLSSIAEGISHGCHRLLGVDALRMAGFVLAHRTHTAKGQQADWWRRTVVYKGKVMKAGLDTRGYLVELDPPVPVWVTRGNIRSQRKFPYPSSAR